jgi:photosystem II stability/assembly factor-like uncharacterized protein
VLVDRKSGALLVNLSDRGVYRSTDAGKTWERLGDAFKGRTETPGCMMIDPTAQSRRLLVPLVYGVPITLGNADKGEWKTMNNQSSHVDWCALDWTDPDHRFVLTLKHESGGKLLASHDGGRSFSEIGAGYGPAWVFDKDTAVVAEAKTKQQPKPGLVRTTDGGKTFQPCGNHSVQVLPHWHGDTLYWLTDSALIASSDKGANWKKISDVKEGRYGPIFGKDASQVFVLTGNGIVESRDGGATWLPAIPLPKALGGVSSLTWLDYDPAGDALYLMKMNSELFRLKR